MEIPAAVQSFWNEFLASIDYDASARFYEAFHFDDNERDANQLARLVLAGTKRATASLLWSYEAENKAYPAAGALSIVPNWQSDPLCVIESTHVSINPYEEVTEQFAAIEGEGDKSLRHWREVHWLYFGRECARLGKIPSQRMPVVCEQFSVIYPAIPSADE